MVQIFIAAGALLGLAGVALSAAAAHVPGGAQADTAARFLLLHAPTLLALAALLGTGLVHPRIGALAGLVLVIGLALFAGDLSMRAFRATALFTRAAPIGGIGLMLGWALVLVAALVPPSR